MFKQRIMHCGLIICIIWHASCVSLDEHLNFFIILEP
jgi:hypothetical protein